MKKKQTNEEDVLILRELDRRENKREKKNEKQKQKIKEQPLGNYSKLACFLFSLLLLLNEKKKKKKKTR